MLYGYMALVGRKAGKVLFNDALNTFYLRLYGIGWKESRTFYLMTHSTHYIYGYMVLAWKVLFNDTLNTFYLRLYGVGWKEGRKGFI